MSQQFGDTGPSGLSAATGYNNHGALKPSRRTVATIFLALPPTRRSRRTLFLAVRMRRDFLLGKNRSSSNLAVVRGCLVFLSLLLLSVKLIAHPAVVVIDPGHA